MSKPKRARGSGSKYLRGDIWWIKYSAHGRPVCESSRSAKESVADRLLTKRLGELEHGTFARGADRVRLGELFQLYVDQCRLKRNKSTPALGQLCRHFDVAETKPKDGTVTYGGGWKVVALDLKAVQDYVQARRKDEAADSTIHNELAALRASLRVGRKARRISLLPHIEMPEVHNVRESYFTVAQFDKLLELLPDWLKAPARFAVLSAWRAANVFALQWTNVDFGRGTARAPTGTTKNGEPIVVPFDHGSELEALLRAQERVKDGPLVFHRDGKRIGNHVKAWRKAVKALDKVDGFEGAGYGEQFDPERGTTRKVLKRFHDLRHTAAQWLTDAGVPAEVIRDVGGWKTATMLDRYRIQSDEKKRAALTRRDRYEAEERTKATPVLPFQKAAGA